MEIGDRIRDARERLGLTQAVLAKAVGVSKNTVSNWETGVHEPTLWQGRLREALGLDENWEPSGSARVRQLRDMSLNELAGRMNAVVSELNAISVELSHRFSQVELEGSQAPRHAHQSPGVQYYTVARGGSEELDYDSRTNVID